MRKCPKCQLEVPLLMYVCVGHDPTWMCPSCVAKVVGS